MLQEEHRRRFRCTQKCIRMVAWEYIVMLVFAFEREWPRGGSTMAEECCLEVRKGRITQFAKICKSNLLVSA